MFKSIFKSVVGAKCSAVEAETISKNAVSPKNQRSRRNLFMLALCFIAVLFASCEKDPNKNNDGGADTGLYLGIVGFNNNLQSKDISKLNEDSKYTFKDFVDNMSPANGTVLYYAVDAAIDKLQAATLPSDVVNVSIVTFTDGLDQGSLGMNEEYGTNADYLNAVNARIKNVKIKGLNISAYSIGIRGNDVSDVAQFQTNLQKLASKPANATEVTNMTEVTNKFKEIAASLYSESTSQSIELTIPVKENGQKIRFTFDNVSNASTSILYIEGVYNFSDKTLTNVVYQGMNCTSGTTVAGVKDGAFVTFSFENLKRTNGTDVPTSNIKQWDFLTSTSQWQINSEFDGNANIKTDVKQTSAVIMLVLDCSSSLGSQFGNMQSSAKNFIDVLLGGTVTPPDPPTNDKAKVRFQKTDAYEMVPEMFLIDASGEIILASYEFGSSSGISPYYEIVTGNHFPVYYYASGDEYENLYYCLDEKSYNFQANKKYTVKCSDDGQYLVFSVVYDGTY
ncbi:MAG: hypothetical protein LBS50_03035 [Prevotellaceae bacterium]|jgi:hypothetical protein|nr:hypothetical protein [Prevotellaceae bacterium]